MVEVDSLTMLERLREPWNALLSRCPDATPFHAPEWLLPWTERYGQGALFALAVFRGDTLVGLAPWRIAPGVEGRTLSFLGSPITDYHGVLVAPGPAGQGVLDAMLAHLQAAAARWDVCRLEELRSEDPLLEVPFPDGFESTVEEQSVCPYVPLEAPGDVFTEGLPDRLGPRLARYLRSLRRAGSVEFERGDEHNAEEIMESLFRLHAARWATRNAPGVLDGPTLQDFHREVAAGMMLRGRLRLHALRVGGSVEAVVYAFAHGRRIYSYIGGFNPVLARFSPGLLLLWQTMLAAIEDGIDEFDFLRGDEAYKHRFGTCLRKTYRRVIRPA